MARAIDSSYLLQHKRKVMFFGLGPDDERWGYAVPVEVIESAPTLTQPNEPLTLEVLAKSQLLQMLGEKVEVIRMGEMCQAEWATVRSFGDCKTDSGRLCCHDLYGKTWMAYRRPPEGERETDGYGKAD